MKMKKAPKCKKGFPCGKTCISRTRLCWANLSTKDSRIAENFGQFINRLVGIPQDDSDSTNNSKLKYEMPLSEDNFKEMADIIKEANGRPLLEYLYEKYNYNKKPEIVEKISDLEKRDDVLLNNVGGVQKIYRGVKGKEYIEEFKRSDKHYVGMGVHGNGTYTAYNESGDNEKALREAKFYSDEFDNSTLMAMAVKKEAKIATFEEYDQIRKEYRNLKRFFAQNGVEANLDFSVLVAMMGYDGFAVEQKIDDDGNDFMVILNRGVLVVANEPPSLESKNYMERIVYNPDISRKLAQIRNKHFQGFDSIEFWDFLEIASETDILSFVNSYNV